MCMYIRVQLPYPYSYSYPYPYPYAYPYPYTLYHMPYTIPYRMGGIIPLWYSDIMAYYILFITQYPLAKKSSPPPVLSPPLFLCRKQQNVCPFASKLKARGGGGKGGRCTFWREKLRWTLFPHRLCNILTDATTGTYILTLPYLYALFVKFGENLPSSPLHTVVRPWKVA